MKDDSALKSIKTNDDCKSFERADTLKPTCEILLKPQPTIAKATITVRKLGWNTARDLTRSATE